MPGVKIKNAKSCDKFCKKFFLMIIFLFPLAVYVGIMQSQCCSSVDAIKISAITFLGIIEILIICVVCIFLGKCFLDLRRSCSYFKKLSAQTIKELLLEAGHQVSTDWTVAEQVGKFYLKDFRRLLKKQYRHSVGLFLAGSVAERFGKPICSDLDKRTTDLMTDFDYMVYLKDISAVAVTERDSDIYIQTKEEGIMTGYAKLYCTPNLSSTFPTESGGVLSAGHLMKQLYELLGNTDASFYPGFMSYLCSCQSYGQTIDFQQNGPALRVQIRTVSTNCCSLSRNGFVADIVFSIYSPEWPEASDWPTRKERNWPSVSDVENIMKNGCHLIPKSQPTDEKKITWRFSFSNAEVQLSKLVNQVAQKCFICLKVIGRHYLEPKCEKFRSYHLKSIFFYTLEKTQLGLWTDHNIEKVFQKLLDELLQTLSEKRCPHFWISEIDLYEGIEAKSLKSLYRTALKIRQNPAPYIKKMVGLFGDLFPHKILTYIPKWFSSDGPSEELEQLLGEPPEEIICIK